jgi:branched-chain amino acid transport system permease protein
MLKNNLLKPKPVGLLAAITALVVLPFFLQMYYLSILTMFLINLIIVTSYRVVINTAGWSCCHLVVVGLGAYTTAILTKIVGLPFWPTFLLGGLVAALVGLALSYPLLRTVGFGFFISSYAAGEAITLTWLRLKFPFGGYEGLLKIPSPGAIPGLPMIDLSRPIPYYFLVLGVTLVSLLIMYQLDRSRLGATLRAISLQGGLAESVGIDTMKYNRLAFTVASLFCGIAGVLMAHYSGSVSPGEFGVLPLLYLFVWVVVGGVDTFAGPIIGLSVMTGVSQALVSVIAWMPLIYGCILIFMLLVVPEGLESIPRRVSSWLRRRA